MKKKMKKKKKKSSPCNVMAWLASVCIKHDLPLLFGFCFCIFILSYFSLNGDVCGAFPLLTSGGCGGTELKGVGIS